MELEWWVETGYWGEGVYGADSLDTLVAGVPGVPVAPNNPGGRWKLVPKEPLESLQRRAARRDLLAATVYDTGVEIHNVDTECLA
jgi:hypothetical protein